MEYIEQNKYYTGSSNIHFTLTVILMAGDKIEWTKREKKNTGKSVKNASKTKSIFFFFRLSQQHVLCLREWNTYCEISAYNLDICVQFINV